MELITKEKEEGFEYLIYFEKEISNPNLIKRSLDDLVNKLNKTQVGHKNRVITKVIGRDKLKKSVTMRIYIEVDDKTKIDEFIEQYEMYKFLDKFTIEKGYMISISNNMEEFKQAVNMFMSEVKNDNSGLDNYDVLNNNIIEVSRISYDGTVLGFDLYMEIKIYQNENILKYLPHKNFVFTWRIDCNIIINKLLENNFFQSLKIFKEEEYYSSLIILPIFIPIRKSLFLGEYGYRSAMVDYGRIVERIGSFLEKNGEYNNLERFDNLDVNKLIGLDGIEKSIFNILIYK